MYMYILLFKLVQNLSGCILKSVFGFEHWFKTSTQVYISGGYSIFI